VHAEKQGWIYGLEWVLLFAIVLASALLMFTALHIALR
jgi:hypothetical protein